MGSRLILAITLVASLAHLNHAENISQTLPKPGVLTKENAQTSQTQTLNQSIGSLSQSDKISSSENSNNPNRTTSNISDKPNPVLQIQSSKATALRKHHNSPHHKHHRGHSIHSKKHLHKHGDSAKEQKLTHGKQVQSHSHKQHTKSKSNLNVWLEGMVGVGIVGMLLLLIHYGVGIPEIFKFVKTKITARKGHTEADNNVETEAVLSSQVNMSEQAN